MSEFSEFKDLDMNKLHDLFSKNPLAWGYYFFPLHFRSKSPAFHLEIIMAILNNKKVVIKAPRGSAKTTLINFLLPAWGICFKRFRNIILLQSNESKSMENLASLKEEFNSNELLKSVYNIKFDRDNQKKTIFELPDGYKVQVSCFGREQMGKVRGSKFGAYRPDLIIIDDLEDDEMIRNREIREDLHRVYKDAIEPAVDIVEDYRIVYIDTLKHYDSQLAKMISKEMYLDYKKLEYSARIEDKNGNRKSLWPEKWSLEYLDKLEKDDPINFYKEYQGNPISADAQSFDPKDFRRWKVEIDSYVCYDQDGSVLLKGKLSDCKCAIGYDLAWEEGRRHDYTSIVPCFLTPDNVILVDYYVNKKGIKPDELSDIMFDFDDKYLKLTGKMVRHGFEKGKYEKVAKWYLTQEYKKRNKYLCTSDVNWVTDKKERVIAVLQPRYSNNSIFHRKEMGDLESQLCRFPSGAHDDLCDSLHNAVKLLIDAPEVKIQRDKTEDDRFKEIKEFFFDTKKPIKRNLIHKVNYSIPASKSWNV